jgi:RluA family pseudouridine synthase
MIEVLLETSDWLALDKPEGMATIPGGDWAGSTLLSEAEAMFGQKLYVVHRLDKETSGVVVFARTPEAHRILNELFSQRRIAKTYVALLHGVVAAPTGQIRGALREFGSGRVAIDARRGKESLTRYEVSERLRAHTLVEAHPQTGRRHQLRAHFYSIGHPIVGDRRYGRRQDQSGFPRLMLHARAITLPVGPGKEITVEAPIPESFRRIMDDLRMSEAAGQPGTARAHRS